MASDTITLDRTKLASGGCVCLIGMAGVGKTTVGKLLAERLGWAHVDTDQVMESYFGRSLQAIMDNLGREEFLRAEERLVSAVGFGRTVISTGGSVVYGRHAVHKLRMLGAVVYLKIGLDALMERFTGIVDRGFVMAEDQTFADVFAERQPLYEAAADFTVATDEQTPAQSVDAILAWLLEGA